MIVPRLGATAQLANTRGPAAQQIKEANDLASHICTQMNDIFQRGENVSLEKLQDMLKPHAEGINFDVVPLTKSSQRRGFSGRVDYHMPKGTITKCSVQLPCQKNLLQPENMNTIGHELTHFFTCIKLPKVMARSNISSLAKPRLNTRSNISLAIGLSSSVLGGAIALLGGHWCPAGATVPYLGIFLGQKISKLLVPTKAFEHYDKVLYNLREATTKDLDQIKQLTKDALNQTKLSSNEKIDMLQSWRYGMINEQNAYKNGGEIEIGIDAINGGYSSDKHLSWWKYYHFDEKIEMVEDLLKDEIAAHREAHRKTLRKS